jgi:tetratricopeptide (TPR) repeat protein
MKSSNEAAIICNILSMSFLQKENFNVSLELLRKAESLTEEGDRFRAVTYNNFACVFRRTKKLRSALSYLEKALEIEYNYLHFSDETVDECLQVSNPCDIHLNICAILSQMSKHELALQHAMKALILI